jgi:hypothetical protein
LSVFFAFTETTIKWNRKVMHNTMYNTGGKMHKNQMLEWLKTRQILAYDIVTPVG